MESVRELTRQGAARRPGIVWIVWIVLTVVVLPRLARADPVHLHFRGEVGAKMGWSAAAVGDMDSDGFTDFAISAPTLGPGDSQFGAVFLCSGRSGRSASSRPGLPTRLPRAPDRRRSICR